MANDIAVAVDAMGGDNAPMETVKGAVAAAAEFKFKIILVGIREKIETELNKYSYDKNLISIVNASEVIETDEVPTLAVKQKKDSSIVVGLNLLKEGKAGAFVSCGNTGALLTGATVIVGRIKGVERPALGTLIPNTKGFSFLIDSGANVDAKPSYLLQFGKIGSVYMENVLNIENPRVGLCNIGAEKEKGNALTKEAYELLSDSGINFIGNAEARDIPQGVCDVIVCDAFVGNIILKYSEGFAKAIMSIIKQELMSGTISKAGALLSKGAFRNVKKRFDYQEVGGAPFLGLKALVVKAHGSSNAQAFKNAIKQCGVFIERDIVSKIESNLAGDGKNGVR